MMDLASYLVTKLYFVVSCHKVERVSNCKIRLKLDTSNMHDCYNTY